MEEAQRNELLELERVDELDENDNDDAKLKKICKSSTNRMSSVFMKIYTVTKRPNKLRAPSSTGVSK